MPRRKTVMGLSEEIPCRTVLCCRGGYKYPTANVSGVISTENFVFQLTLMA